MLIAAPTRPLGEVDTHAFAEHLLSLQERDWYDDLRRQESFEVHAETQSILLAFCSGWPQVQVARTPQWDRFSEFVTPLIDRIIQQYYSPGGQVLRAMLTRLPAGCRIAKHRDAHQSFAVAHRIHVPLVTNPDVEFIVGPQRVPPRAHYAFELNNSMPHQVANRGDSQRIHFIFDYVPPPPVR